MKKGLDSKKVEPNPSLIFELTHFKRQCLKKTKAPYKMPSSAKE